MHQQLVITFCWCIIIVLNCIFMAINFDPIGSITNLIGSVLGYKAQNKATQANVDAVNATNLWNYQQVKETNAMNRIIAHDTNMANARIAEMNNQYNRENLQMQMDFNREQQEKEMAYNSATAQAARLIAAGINPANSGALSGGSVSALQSPSAAPASEVGRAEMPPPAIAARAQAPQIDNSSSLFQSIAQGFSAMGDAVDKFYKGFYTNEDVRSRLRNMQAEYDSIKEDTYYKQMLGYNLQIGNLLLEDTYQLNIDELSSKVAVLQAQKEDLMQHVATQQTEQQMAQLNGFVNYCNMLLGAEANETQKMAVANQLRASVMQYNAQMASTAAYRDVSAAVTKQAEKEMMKSFTLGLINAGIEKTKAVTMGKQLGLETEKFEFGKSWKGVAISAANGISQGLGFGVGATLSTGGVKGLGKIGNSAVNATRKFVSKRKAKRAAAASSSSTSSGKTGAVIRPGTDEWWNMVEHSDGYLGRAHANRGGFNIHFNPNGKKGLRY